MRFADALRTIAAAVAGGNPCPRCRARPSLLFVEDEAAAVEWQASQSAAGCGGRCGQPQYPTLAIIGLDGGDM